MRRQTLLETHHADHLPEKLLSLLPHNPEAVFQVALRIAQARQMHASFHVGKGLVGIALLLQRLGGDFRLRGFELLDLLYEPGSREAEEFVRLAGSPLHLASA